MDTCTILVHYGLQEETQTIDLPNGTKKTICTNSCIFLAPMEVVAETFKEHFPDKTLDSLTSISYTGDTERHKRPTVKALTTFSFIYKPFTGTSTYERIRSRKRNGS